MMRDFPTIVERAIMIQKVILQAQRSGIKWKQARHVRQKPAALEVRFRNARLQIKQPSVSLKVRHPPVKKINVRRVIILLRQIYLMIAFIDVKQSA
jgi:hypothetical protein